MHKKILAILCFALVFVSNLKANDGAYYTSGNQLIPTQETDISVQKEILTLKKIKHDAMEVTVYYEFFNPSEAKTLTVGFEANAPGGDVNGLPLKGEHPNIRNFTVVLNDENLPYHVAFVNDTLYRHQGKFNEIDTNTFKDMNVNMVDFNYVYHFEARFNKGLNIIKHTYTYDLSGSVDLEYNFEYILSAAMRWANHQIDDFTLILDMGDFESFQMPNSFFNSANAWRSEGKAIIKDFNYTDPYSSEKKKYTQFHVHNGKVIFKALNFQTKEELFVQCPLFHNSSVIDNKLLPFSYYSSTFLEEPTTPFERKVWKNLPFARRGYVFKNQELQTRFEQMEWYIPDPNYTPNTEGLHPLEIEWILKYKD